MRKLPKNLCILFFAAAFTGTPILPAFAQETQQAQSDAIPAAPAGEPKTPKTRLLEAGAKLLQTTSPLKPFDIYLVGFHPMKDHSENQMVAHHYCHQVNEDFAQCALFDGNTKDANLNLCGFYSPSLVAKAG